MKKKQLIISAVLLSFALLFSSCNNDDTITPSEKNDLVEKSKEVEKKLQDRSLYRFDIGGIDKIEVICHSGHLHGKSFHANAQPEGTPYQRKQVLVLKRTQNNTWKQVRGNKENELRLGKSFVTEGGGIYAFEFIYYNKKGKRINTTFSRQSDIYQTLFSIDSYKRNKTNNVTKTQKGGKELISYSYRDTNPEYKMFKTYGTMLSYSRLGLKGYFKLLKGRVSFQLKVNLVKFKNTYNKKKSPIYENINKRAIEEMITFELPINAVTQRADTDDEVERYYQELAEYFNMPTQKFQDLEWGDIDFESSKYWM